MSDVEGFEDTRVRASSDIGGDRFRILAPLGAGGMGTVYLAERLDSVGERVAVKVLHGAIGQDRFENEARILFNLKSPFVCRPIELGRTPEGRPMLVMEYLEGRTLLEALTDGGLSEEALLGIARDICLALEEAHALGIVHRDLKPANVFLQRVGTREVVKVLDFGVAKLHGEVTLAVPLVERDDPTRGLVGSPSFMAPEQTRGEAVSASTDLFALGLILHRGLSGRDPYDYPSDEPNAVLFTHATRPPRPLAHDRRGAPIRPELGALVDALVAFRPEDRPHGAEEVAGRLDRLIGSVAAPAPEAARPRRTGGLNRWAPVWVPGVAAVTAIGALLAIRGAGPDAPPIVGAHHAESAVAQGSTADRTPPEAQSPAAPIPEPPPEPKRRAPKPWRVASCLSLSGVESSAQLEAEFAAFAPGVQRCARGHGGRSRSAKVRLRRQAGELYLSWVGNAAPKGMERCLSAVASRGQAARGGATEARRAGGRLHMECTLRR